MASEENVAPYASKSFFPLSCKKIVTEWLLIKDVSGFLQRPCEDSGSLSTPCSEYPPRGSHCLWFLKMSFNNGVIWKQKKKVIIIKLSFKT